MESDVTAVADVCYYAHKLEHSVNFCLFFIVNNAMVEAVTIVEFQNFLSNSKNESYCQIDDFFSPSTILDDKLRSCSEVPQQ